MTRVRYVGRWRVDLTIRDGVRSPVSGALLARTVVAAGEAAGAATPVSVGLILTDDLELAALNEAHLGKSGPTDVLAFPMLLPEAFPARIGGHRRSIAARTPASDPVPDPVPKFRLPPGRRPHLGDIVISVERAVAQAVEGRGGQTGDVRWSPADELRLLATHGALHLCGWEHADPADEAAMRNLEDRLLSRVG